MGHGIGQVFAAQGHTVWLFDVNEDALSSAKERVRANLTNMANQGVKFDLGIDEILDLICTTPDLGQACQSCDFVFEAVFEDLELKQHTFAELDRLCPPDTIYAATLP
jgi:3-hydroxybutyryl-CoA dehydrogenase